MEAKDVDERKELLAMSLLLRGRSLCNFALDGDSDEILSKWKAHDDWIYSLAVSPDGKHVATGDWAGRVKIWESKNEAVSLARELPQVPGN